MALPPKRLRTTALQVTDVTAMEELRSINAQPRPVRFQLPVRGKFVWRLESNMCILRLLESQHPHLIGGHKSYLVSMGHIPSRDGVADSGQFGAWPELRDIETPPRMV